MTLIERPFDEGVILAQVEYVIFVDPRRYDQERTFKGFFRRGFILDELDQVILINNRAWRRCEIAADLKGVVVGRADLELAVAAFEVADQIFQAFYEVFA